MFFDTHSHIHVPQYFEDGKVVLARAERAHVSHQLIVGCTVKDSLLAVEFVKDNPDSHLWATLGVHPHNADEWNGEVAVQFSHLLDQDDKIVAFGEMGLDYFRNFQPHDLQQKVFAAQLDLAKKHDVPVVVHVREAWDDALAILKGVGNSKVILHCFTGTMQQAEECWKRGYHTSFSGVLTYPRNDYLRDVAAAAPADKILLETDSPYLAPQPYRGKMNEPAYIVETALVLARVRGVSSEEVAGVTTGNAKLLLGI